MKFPIKTEKSNIMKGSEEPSCKGKLRIAVFGPSQVGKSALTVRYLTKRFIGEYQSNSDMFYHQTLTVNHGTPLEIEIVDISTCENSPLSEPSKWDGIILVYSITSKASFDCAAESLAKLATAPALPPVILIGNKSDLEHLRQVDKIDGLSLSMEFGCHFYELSVAENSPQVYQSFTTIINNVTKPKRRFSVSKILFRLGKIGIAHKQSSSSSSDSSSSSSSTSSETSFDSILTPCRNNIKNKGGFLSPKKTICS